jgi:hypothetical protein
MCIENFGSLQYTTALASNQPVRRYLTDFSQFLSFAHFRRMFILQAGCKILAKREIVDFKQFIDGLNTDVKYMTRRISYDDG